MPRPQKRTSRRPPAAVVQDSEQPLYEQVKSYIREQIESGRLKRGERLPTLREFSADLGIAYATVARGMKDLVREGVLDARTARGTRVAMRRSERLRAIGLLGRFPVQELLESTRYYRQLVGLLQAKIIQRDQTVVYNRWPEDAPLSHSLNHLQLVDALLLLGVDETRLDDVKAVRRMGVPVICLGDTIRDHAVPAVHSDNTGDVHRAVQALLQMGHRRIVFVGLAEASDRVLNELRLSAYRQAIEASGIATEADRSLLGTVDEQVAWLLSLRPRPTAVLFNANLSHFPRFHSLLQGSPLDLHRHLHVCVYDESLWSTVSPLQIPYLSIEQSLEKIAELAVDNVIGMLNDEGFEPGWVEVPSAIVRVTADGFHQRV